MRSRKEITLRIMEYNLFIILMLVFILLNRGQSQDLMATMTPPGFTAVEGTVAVTFTCVVRSNERLIFNSIAVNGKMLTVDELERRGITQGTIDETTSTLTIPTTRANNGTLLQCIAGTLMRSTRFRNYTFFIQGVLSQPIVMQESNSISWRFHWNPPFTLDITNRDPDISGYRTCLNLTQPTNSTCVVSQDTSYEVLKIRVPFRLSVTALNAAGESNPSITFQQACDQSVAPSRIDIEQVSIRVSEDLSSFTVEFQPPSSSCYDLYRVEVTPTTPQNANSLRFGPLIPTLSGQTLQLQVPARLQQGTDYAVKIIAVNVNGEIISNNRTISGNDMISSADMRPGSCVAVLLLASIFWFSI